MTLPQRALHKLIIFYRFSLPWRWKGRSLAHKVSAFASLLEDNLPFPLQGLTSYSLNSSSSKCEEVTGVFLRTKWQRLSRKILLSLVLKWKTQLKGWKGKIHSWHYACVEGPLGICPVHHRKPWKTQACFKKKTNPASYKITMYCIIGCLKVLGLGHNNDFFLPENALMTLNGPHLTLLRKTWPNSLLLYKGKTDQGAPELLKPLWESAAQFWP